MGERQENKKIVGNRKVTRRRTRNYEGIVIGYLREFRTCPGELTIGAVENLVEALDKLKSGIRKGLKKELLKVILEKQKEIEPRILEALYNKLEAKEKQRQKN